MPSIDVVCQQVADVVSVLGLRSKGYADDTINAPEAQVYTRAFDPRMILGDSKRSFALGVRVFVSRTDPRSAQATIRGYMEPSGATSIKGAVEDPSNWTEVVDYAEVTGIGQPFELETTGGVYWCVDFDVDVIW